LQQYISTETSTINIPGYTEERIKIESLEATEKANVSAGTVLINDRFPQVNFVIGNYRNINGEVSGDILTALNPESDLLYRERLLSSIINPSSNYIYLRNLILNQGDIANVLFHTPEPGYVNVWLRVKTTISNSRLNALQQLINENMFIGIQPSVKLLNPKGISFKVRVYNIQFNQGLVTNIREYINYYLDNLSYRESLVKSSLEQYLKLKTRTLVEVVIPQDEIFIAEEQQCFTLNSLEVIYNV
jgi:hypothetical protein